MKISCIQMDVKLAQPQENYEAAERLIRDFDGRSPRELAAGIIGQGEEDDRTAVVLKLQRVSSHLKDTISCR